jgi:hypothetical protein
VRVVGWSVAVMIFFLFLSQSSYNWNRQDEVFCGTCIANTKSRFNDCVVQVPQDEEKLHPWGYVFNNFKYHSSSSSSTTTCVNVPSALMLAMEPPSL